MQNTRKYMLVTLESVYAIVLRNIDMKNRPDNSELARHFHDKHTLDDMKVTILQSDLERTSATGEFSWGQIGI